MTDYSELKKAAEDCDVSKCADEAEYGRRLAEFFDACEPEDILALIAESESAHKHWANEANNAEALVAEIVRLAGVSAEMTVHDAVGRAASDYLAVVLERDQLKAENEALRKDAERYRWLRDQHWNEADMAVVCHPKSSVKLGFDCPSGNRLDESIDTAMGKGKQA